jgi:hypothetical protein
MLRRTCAGVSALGWPSSTPSALSWHKPRGCLFNRQPNISIGVAAWQSMASCAAGHHAAAEAEQQQLMHLLADAHAHPQLDPANMQRVKQLQCCHVAAMSVSYDVDWDIMLQLHQMAGVQTTHCMLLLLLCITRAPHLYHTIINHGLSTCAPMHALHPTAPGLTLLDGQTTMTCCCNQAARSFQGLASTPGGPTSMHLAKATAGSSCWRPLRRTSCSKP